MDCPLIHQGPHTFTFRIAETCKTMMQINLQLIFISTNHMRAFSVSATAKTGCEYHTIELISFIDR